MLFLNHSFFEYFFSCISNMFYIKWLTLFCFIFSHVPSDIAVTYYGLIDLSSVHTGVITHLVQHCKVQIHWRIQISRIDPFLNYSGSEYSHVVCHQKHHPSSGILMYVLIYHSCLTSLTSSRRNHLTVKLRVQDNQIDL